MEIELKYFDIDYKLNFLMKQNITINDPSNSLFDLFFIVNKLFEEMEKRKNDIYNLYSSKNKKCTLNDFHCPFLFINSAYKIRDLFRKCEKYKKIIIKKKLKYMDNVNKLYKLHIDMMH